MLLRIRSITYLAARINGYELVDPEGHDLPRFSQLARRKTQSLRDRVRRFRQPPQRRERSR